MVILLGLGSGLYSLRIGLWLEWYLGLGCSFFSQYTGGASAEIFPISEPIDFI